MVLIQAIMNVMANLIIVPPTHWNTSAAGILRWVLDIDPIDSDFSLART